MSHEELIRLIDGVKNGEGGDGKDDGLGIGYNLANFRGGADVDSLRHFTTVSSAIYPNLFRHYDALHDYWVRGVKFYAKAAGNTFLIPEEEE